MSARDTEREDLVKAMPEGPLDDDDLAAVGAGSALEDEVAGHTLDTC